MPEIENDIKRVKSKLQQLLKQYQALQKENERLQQEANDMRIARQRDTAEIEQLRQQVSILKSAMGQLTEADKKAFDKQLSRYIKDIDKCIALLGE
jgi:phage host-nuclease inhibitor protein Gam